MKAFLSGLVVSALLVQSAFATEKTPTLAPMPTACIGSAFSSTGNQYWKSIDLKLTNNCGTTVDFQNAAISFENGIALNTNFWGDFAPLPYPDNELRIVSQPPQSGGNFLATLNLHFPTYPGASSLLPAGKSITLKYGAVSESHVEGSLKVYLGEAPPPVTGSIAFTNASAKPANVTQTYALVHLTMNGQNISDIQLPWSGMLAVPGLAPGNYAISAESVTGSTGSVYQGSAVPATINLAANQTAQTTISYALVNQPVGKLAIQLQALPAVLAGYTGKPTTTVTEAGTGSAVPAALNWGMTTTVSQLKNGSSYSFTTPTISFNGATCTPTFTPGTLVASATTTPTTSLTYTCSQVAQTAVTLNVNGAPTSLASLKVTLTPNNNTAPVMQTVTLTNGTGTGTAMLTTGVVYTVSADAVAGYNIAFNPQPLTAMANAIETITLTQQPTTGTPVSINGQLHVCGTQLCNESNQPIQLKGMSSHGIQWYGWQGSNTEKACLTTASLDALATGWGASVLRISMYIQEDGYETNPAAFTAQVNQLIDEATKRGIYAIVDWHMLEPGNPNFNLERAKTFFTAIANAHKNNNNLLYEIANEPSGVTWATIKSYADQLIPVIRAVDPKTVILVGTPAWSSLGISDGRSSQDIISNPVNFPNIMYTFHFYAASHKDQYLNELDKASNTIPMFVTEFGTQTFTGDGGNDFAMADRYMELMARKKISWTNWNYSDDFRSGAVWKTGTCSGGPWTDANLKPAGVYIKGKIKA